MRSKTGNKTAFITKEKRKSMKKIIALVGAAAVCLSLAACSQQGNDYPVKIASYTFNERPDSVACLNDSVADILIACGYADRITVRSDECTQEELKNIPSAGKKSSPDISKITSAGADVVFADNTLSDESKKSLKDTDTKVMTMISAKNTGDLKMLYKNICAVVDGNNTGRDRGSQSVSEVIMTLDDLQRVVPESQVEKTACYLYDLEEKAATSSTFSGKLFDYAKTINVFDTVKQSTSLYNILMISNPQYIFCEVGLKDTLMSDDKYRVISAVMNDRVYEISSNEFDRQGLTLTSTLTTIIESEYPELINDSSSQETSVAENSKDTQESKQESSEPSGIQVKEDKSLKVTSGMTFKKGDESEDFKKVQKRLKDLGYFNDDITGYFGDVTEKAVKQFEKINSEETDGVLSTDDLILLFSADVKAADYKQDSSKQESSKQESSKQESSKQESSKQESSKQESSTVKADNSLNITDDMSFGKGDNNDDLKKIQTRLKTLGYFNDDITGYFGDVTQKAFKDFEKNNGLDTDGYMATEDLRLLFSDKAKAK